MSEPITLGPLPSARVGRMRFATLLVAGNLLLMALLSTLAALVLGSGLQAHREVALAAVENVTISLAGRLEAELRQADLALLGARGELARLAPGQRADASIVDAILRSHHQLLPALESLRMTDEAGVVRFGNDLAQPVDLTVRPFYAQAKNAGAEKLVISEPVKSRVSGHWVVALARRVDHADGRFAGVVYATLPLGHVQAMLEGVDLGADGAVTVRYLPSLALVARRAGDGSAASEPGSTNVSEALHSALAVDASQGHFVTRVAIDGIRRVSAYRSLRSYPFLVLAGQAEDTLLAPWREQVVQTVGLTALLVVLLAAGSIIIYRDRGERQRLLERLEDAARRVQDLYDNAPCGYHSLDTEGRIVHVNQTAARWLGQPAQALRGRWLGDFLSPPERDRLQRKLQRVAAEGAVSDVQFDLTMPGGSHMRVRADVSAERDVDGRLLTTRSVWHDITRQHAVELELREARDVAEAANRLKAQFLANMSHEIRTPMNGVIGMTAHVLEGTLTPEQRENLEIVQSSAHSLLALLDDLLDFSKIDAGRLDLESVAFDLRRRLGMALQPFSQLAQDKGIELVIDVSPQVPRFLLGDPTRLMQVFVNLVSNAVKFTLRGRVHCQVDGEQAADGTVRLECHVSDTGPGIPVDAQSRLFQPFVQADGTITRRHGGTGLGLAICRGLVTAMGGSISFEAPPGAGTRIAFTLSLGQAIDGDATSPTESDASVDADGEALDVLVVEDHPVNSRLAERVLGKRGHRVTVVADGSLALDAMAQRRFDLVLMDLQMPVMDGVSAMLELRRRESLDGRHTPIVALTANALKGERERLLELGMDGFLAKPFTPGQLLQAVAAHARARVESIAPA